MKIKCDNYKINLFFILILSDIFNYSVEWFFVYFYFCLKHELRDLIDSLNVLLVYRLMVVVLYAFFFKKLTQTATAATNDINKGVIISCFILNKNR